MSDYERGYAEAIEAAARKLKKFARHRYEISQADAREAVLCVLRAFGRDGMEKRAKEIRLWLEENSPFVFADQNHLNENSPERSYWHHGYMSALNDSAVFSLNGGCENCDELKKTFDLMWAADQRAIKIWQEMNSGNDLNWPDRTKLTLWLLEQRAAILAAIEGAIEYCKIEAAKLGGVNGYDYKSGEEFGLRRAELDLSLRLRSILAAAPASTEKAEGER